ncbi:TonB-dependent receptor [Piscinibacter sakaiensis]|uniref:TonB-dependent receptor plug domain-containing protein n=1 Tax=Piscinibacter sakaiensis TaxID=1547922 RepID=UPI00372B3A3A
MPASAPSAAQELGRVQVTGSRLKRIDAEGPVPVQVYRREDLERSGQPSLAKFLNSLNETSMSSGEGANSGTAGQGTVQLRGMPLGSTAVLLNGRKLQAVGSSSASYFNLNLIPIGAIERIEVLPVGSSAVYGGDALAGVVNVVLKSRLDALSLDARVGGGRGFEDGSLALAGGRQNTEGSVLILGSYSKATTLGMSERDFFLDADYRRFGGPDARVRTCAPGTVSSNTNGNLPGLAATSAGIPVTSAGRPTLADFAAAAGRPNLCGDAQNGNGNALVYGNETLGLHTVAERHLGAGWTAFAEATLSEDRLASNFTGMKFNNVLVPASNPYNPFGVPVRVTSTLGLENGSVGIARETRYTRLLGGLRGELPGAWDLEATVTSSRDRSEQRNRNVNVNANARTAALAASDPALALNPFTAGRAATDAVIQSIWSDSVRQTEGSKDMFAAFVRGPAAALPAGSLDAVVGAEVTRDRYDSLTVGTVSNGGSRSAQALYGELRAPLMRRDGVVGRGGELAALTLAARSDRTAQFGRAATYQGGLELRPSASWLLRASAATSLKPPTLSQTFVTDQVLPASSFGLVDPARQGEAVTAGELVRTANPALKPERGKAFSLGANWEPQTGTRLAVTAWRLRAEQLIVLLLPQALLNNEALLPGFVTREAATAGGLPGRLSRLTYAETNLGVLETRGIDLEARRSWRSPGGTWSLGVGATRVQQYDVKLTPNAAVESRLGRRTLDYWSPEWKGQVFGGFAAPAWSLSVTGRYLGAYQDTGSRARRLGDTVLVDLAGRLDLRTLGVPMGGASAAALSFGVVNVGDRQPQFTEAAPYYDPTQADWRGRTLSVRLSVDW